MSIRAPERPEEITAELEVLPEELPGDVKTTIEEGRADEEQPVNVVFTTLAVFFSSAAAGWMCAGIFRGFLPKIVALVAALLGPGVVAISYRTRRPSLVQYLGLPLAALVGAILVLPDAQGGTANLPGLISEAVRSGGVAQPPIPFDPGWRFILVVLIAVVGAAGASLATALNRPKIGMFFPVPLLFGAALLQPPDAGLLSIGIALVLFICALAVSFGVELAAEGATSTRFETRRFARGAAIVVLLVAALAGLSRLGFLFPDTQRNQVVPPKRPDAQPPQKDRLLFTVTSPRNLPWRLGVLDVYDGKGWLLPPYDTGRLKDIPDGGVVPNGPADDSNTVSVSFRVNDIEGHVLPTVALPRSVRRTDFAVQFDPRTQALRLPDKRASRGMTYTVEAREPPSGAELAKAGTPPPSMKEFLSAPTAPSTVQSILDQAPQTDPFNRLQFVRDAYYKKVVAAGAGQPVDVPPYRVADMLDGKEATPYEITAGEVLLARWAGVPARIGYGFYGGERPTAKSNSYAIHPKHGSTWLEAYFDGFGWVPIVGIPPKAKASLSQAQKNEQQIRATEDLALIVYVPIRQESIRLLYTAVRYWLAIITPIVAGALLIWAFFPGVVKLYRRWWRRRWARARGTWERIAVAYAEFRDAANDLNIGDPAATALEFRNAVAPDAEHDELAWLVTRALWGDLGRDLRREDAEAAEDLARSVTRRLRRAQGGMTRLLAFGSRASLRDPYSATIPRLWPQWARRGSVRSAVRRAVRGAGSIRGPLRRLIPIGTLFGLLLISGCAQEVKAGPGRTKLPDRLVPARIDRYTFAREAKVESAFAKAGANSLVDEGRVFTVRERRDVHGYVEVAAFRPGLGARRKEVRRGVLEGIASGNFQPQRLGRERIHVMRTSEQTFYLWFPPSGTYFSLLVARQGFDDADRLFASVIAYQRGEKAPEVLQQRRIVVIDPRRGGDL